MRISENQQGNTHGQKTAFGFYRPDIDGLRAIAVLAVVLFHAKIGFPGGFVGVDVFFVISGFLISSLILKEMESGTFSLAAFWERRVRRILPALAGIVLAVLVAGYFLLTPEDLAALGKSGIAQALMLSNIRSYRQAAVQGGYFNQTATAEPLLHTWSLAVEEQFYFLFPLLLVFLNRYRKRVMVGAIATIALVSFVLSVFGSIWFPTATFYLLPTRAWELLLGTLLAFNGGRGSANRSVNALAGWSGLALIGGSIFCFTSKTVFPGAAALVPCLGAALIIFSSNADLSPVGRILSFKPAIFVGLISYSLYLWHWPILVFTQYVDLDKDSESLAFRAALVLFSLAMAVLSWRFIETPFRRRRFVQNRPAIFTWAGASLVIICAVGLVLVGFRGAPGRLSRLGRMYASSRSHWAPTPQSGLEDATAGRFPEIGSAQRNAPVKLLVWGDSHAMAVVPVLDKLCQKAAWRGIEVTRVGTPPVMGYIYSMSDNEPVYEKAIVSYVVKNHIPNVVMAARWAYYPQSELLKSNLVATVQSLLNAGTHVYVIKDVPWQRQDISRLTALGCLRPAILDKVAVTPEQYAAVNQGFAGTFKELSRMGAHVMDPTRCLTNQLGVYGVVKNGAVLYWDSDHLSVEGAMLLAPMFDSIFSSPLSLK